MRKLTMDEVLKERENEQLQELAEAMAEALLAGRSEPEPEYPTHNTWAQDWREIRESDNYRMNHPYDSPRSCVRDAYVNSFDY